MKKLAEIMMENNPSGRSKGWSGEATDSAPPAEPQPFPEIAIEKLRASGITPEQAAAAGIVWAENSAACVPGLASAPGLIIRYPDPWAGSGQWHTYPRDGHPAIFARARYLPALEPRRSFGKPKKSVRYGQPTGSPVKAYFPLAPGLDWVAIGGDVSTPLIICEGELKALAAALAREYPCIGLGGVFNWTRKGGLAGMRVFLPEFERIEWAGRTVYLCFDSDRATNPDIVAAEGGLALELARRGATVFRVHLQPAADGSKQGLDDLLAQPDGCTRFEALVAAAEQMREADALVAEMNQNHAVVCHGGKTFIARFGRDESLGRHRIDCLDERSFDLVFRGRTVTDPRTGKRAPLSKVWLAHPDRREYLGGITLAPNAETPPDVLNLWRGFSVEPAPGDWSLLRAHIHDNICAGNTALFEYVMGWLARLVQQPGSPGEVAIVLRGGRGVGKGKFGQWVGRLLSDHFTHAIRANDVVGQFNDHLASTVFLFADEAFFAGNPQHAKILNGLITERTLRSERKYMPAVVTLNCLHILMATNDAWAIPAATGERRYFVLDVAPTRQLDTAYFKAIDDQMETGGLAAMLHDLLALDISRFEVRRVPQTSALADQKRHTLHARGGTLAWLQDVLSAGELQLADGSALPWTGDGLIVARSDLYRAYEDWERRHGRSQRIHDRVWFGRNLALALGPGLRSDNIRVSRRVDPAQPHAYQLGPLEACRAEFAASQQLSTGDGGGNGE